MIYLDSNPKVMTLDEIKSLKVSDVLYIEDFRYDNIIDIEQFCGIYIEQINDNGFKLKECACFCGFGISEEFNYPIEDYGKTWKAWTGDPIKQRNEQNEKATINK